MQFSITFRHMEVSETLKEYAREKLSKLEKYLDSVMVAEVTLTVEKFRHRAEVLITADGFKVQAEEETEDMYSALDLLVDKVERQIKRHREKVKDRKSANSRRSASRTESNWMEHETDLASNEG